MSTYTFDKMAITPHNCSSIVDGPSSTNLGAWDTVNRFTGASVRLPRSRGEVQRMKVSPLKWPQLPKSQRIKALALMGSVGRRSWFRLQSGSLFSFFELAVPHGFTQRGILCLVHSGGVSAIPTRCCDDCPSDRDLCPVPRNNPISIFQTSRASFRLRTLSVLPKTTQKFKTPFGTANQTQP